MFINSFMNSESLGNFVWNHQYFEKFPKNKNFLVGGHFTSFMYIAPSSDHSLMTLNLPFMVLIRRCEVVFWFLEWECCTFQKNDENSIISTNTILLWLQLSMQFNNFRIPKLWISPYWYVLQSTLPKLNSVGLMKQLRLWQILTYADKEKQKTNKTFDFI